MKPIYEEVEVQLHVLNLGTRLRLVFNYTPRSLYPRGKGPRNALNRRLSRSQSQSARYGEIKSLAFDGNRHDSLVNRWQPSHRAPPPSLFSQFLATYVIWILKSYHFPILSYAHKHFLRSTKPSSQLQ